MSGLDRVCFMPRLRFGAHEFWIISPGVLGRSRRTVLYPNAGDATPAQRPPRTLLSNLAHHPARAPALTGQTKRRPARARKTPYPVIQVAANSCTHYGPTDPIGAMPHLYGGQLCAGRQQFPGGSESLSYKRTRSHGFLFVTTSGDYRSSAARDDPPTARILICEGSGVDCGDVANIETVARLLATARDRLRLPPSRHKP